MPWWLVIIVVVVIVSLILWAFVQLMPDSIMSPKVKNVIVTVAIVLLILWVAVNLLCVAFGWGFGAHGGLIVYR